MARNTLLKLGSRISQMNWLSKKALLFEYLTDYKNSAIVLW